ncbi:uncharacterized protein METZ01_LOCUS274989, partial [marine metagenome]
MIEIRPTTNISATVGCPPSKSYTNRALLIAALADGKCRIEFPLFSDDTRYMKEALIQFGIHVHQEENAFVIAGKAGVLSV